VARLQRTRVRAPVTGYIARRGVQLGERIAPGGPLMAIVPLERLRVDANFREVQLKHMRIGQPVTVDHRPVRRAGQVPRHRRRAGPGTGAAFALLPAQNATGNWIRSCSVCRCALHSRGANSRRTRCASDSPQTPASTYTMTPAPARHRRRVRSRCSPPAPMNIDRREIHGAHRADHRRELARGRGDSVQLEVVERQGGGCT